MDAMGPSDVGSFNYIDGPEQDISGVLTPDFFTRAQRRVRRSLDEQLRRAVLRRFAPASSNLSPQEAALILRACASHVEQHLDALASGYSPLRWLWMLRRTPIHVFSGEVRSTFGHDSL